MPRIQRTRRFVTAWLSVAMLLPGATAWADPEAWFKKGLLAYEEGRFVEASQAAENGYLEKKLPKLLVLKAMAQHKIGHLDEAWSLLQLVVPKDLPENLRDTFVQEYEQVEADLKRAGVERDRAKVAAAKQQAAAQTARDAAVRRSQAKASRARTLWIAAGSTAVVGGGLWALGWSTASSAGDLDLTKTANHWQYHDEMATGRLEYWGGVGLVVVAAGLGTWAAIESAGAGEPAAAAVSCLPVVWPDGAGLVVAGRFGR